MSTNITELRSQILHHLSTLNSSEEVVTYKNAVFGKAGLLTELLKNIKNLGDEEKKTLWKDVNDLKVELLSAFDVYEKQVQEKQIEAELRLPKDMTFPANMADKSHLHPITQIQMEVEDVFRRMGFEVFESKEVTSEYLNFDALNVPSSHPARDMQDTFWLEGKGNVLSTQTSSMQNVILKTRTPPIKAIVPGRVFRNEAADATHEMAFYQVEGIVVDKDISVAHLKYTIKTMLTALFGKPIEIRFRPGFFPFTEPGIEVDCSCPFCGESTGTCRVCKGSGWIEFMGSGMIHPEVLRQGGIDPDVYSGFALGFGLSRLAMLKYRINNIRLFLNPNPSFLDQF